MLTIVGKRSLLFDRISQLAVVARELHKRRLRTSEVRSNQPPMASSSRHRVDSPHTQEPKNALFDLCDIVLLAVFHLWWLNSPITHLHEMLSERARDENYPIFQRSTALYSSEGSCCPLFNGAPVRHFSFLLLLKRVWVWKIFPHHLLVDISLPV